MNTVLRTCYSTSVAVALIGGGLASAGTAGLAGAAQNVVFEKCFIASTRAATICVNSIGGKMPPSPFVPKTPMGRAMLAARQRILEAGEALTPAKDLIAALNRSRRGE